MKIESPRFPDNARIALHDANLQAALGNLKTGFPDKRAAAVARLPEFDTLRDEAVAIKNHVIENLDTYLVQFEHKIHEQGGQVHWAVDDQDACQAVLKICQNVDAKTVTKGKSMVTEEIGLNAFLQTHGIKAIETDLGEYILQLRNEHPSHIIAPAIHLNLPQVAETFAHHHKTPLSDDPAILMSEARNVLRDHFVRADVGITGANFFVAETGSTMIVTNEGNGDLTQTLPKVHIVVTSIEKCLPTLEDLSLFMRLLSRSATGQETTVYNTLSSGPKRPSDQDGPDEFHVVLVDNGRAEMVGDDLQDMLRCIRCSACMNHCPVYGQIGGHAYGWVYPGPMGSVLTPKIIGIDQGGHLPNASTFCGKCEEVCPVRIPLPKLMRRWRQTQHETKNNSTVARAGIGLWAWLARHPRLYALAASTVNKLLRLLGGRSRLVRHLPAAKAWTLWRDLPTPASASFQEQWSKQATKSLSTTTNKTQPGDHE